MNSDYIAISYAVEDWQVVRQLTAAMKEKGIRYFDYAEHQDEDWGKTIGSVSLKKFSEAKHVLMVISEHYSENYWTGIENMIAQHPKVYKRDYILPLRIDDTIIDGLSKHKIFVRWNGDPHDIADKVLRKLKSRKPAPAYRKILAAILVLSLTALAWFIYSKNDETIIPGENTQAILKRLYNEGIEMLNDTTFERFDKWKNDCAIFLNLDSLDNMLNRKYHNQDFINKTCHVNSLLNKALSQNQ